MHQLSKTQARRIAVRAQLLDAPRPTSLLAVVEQLTLLQADAFVTMDSDLARRVEGIVPTATIEALQTA